jgi:hypothetical protein
MLVNSTKIRALLTALVAVIAAVVPLLPVGSDVQVALGGLLTLSAALGIVPAHLEVEKSE